MVSNLSIIGILFTCLLTIIFPIGLFVYYRKRYNASFLYFFIGIAVFSIFQLVLRIPMLQLLSGKSWFVIHVSSNTYIYMAFLAITAALFEEIGRFIAFRYVLMDQRKWEDGVAFGIGHGGIEALVIVGINNLLFLLLALNVNYGWLDQIITRFPQIETAKSLLLNTPSELLFASGIERFFVIFIQIAFSLIVLDAVRKNRMRLLFLAIFLHTLLDFLVVLLGTNILIAEGVIAIIGIISMFYIRYKKRFWKFML